MASAPEIIDVQTYCLSLALQQIQIPRCPADIVMQLRRSLGLEPYIFPEDPDKPETAYCVKGLSSKKSSSRESGDLVPARWEEIAAFAGMTIKR